MCQDCISINKLTIQERINELEEEWVLVQEYLENGPVLYSDPYLLKLFEIERELGQLTQEV